MAYFKFLPNIEYLSPLEDKSSIDSYVTAKNLFRRIKYLMKQKQSETHTCLTNILSKKEKDQTP